jgi:acetyl esterase/lipase
MRHRFDPELAAALAMVPPVDIGDLAVARAEQAAQLATEAERTRHLADEWGVRVEEVKAPGMDGAPPVPLRIYRPEDRPGPLPALLSIHGGGFVIGSPDVDHTSNLRFCREIGAAVVAVDYRLAPEHRYPAALDDCLAGLLHLAANADAWGVRPDRIAVWGDSAGAGLATALAMLVRDRGGPALCFQHLHSPALDDRLATPSARAYLDTPVWNRRNALLSWEAYLGPEAAGGPGVPATAAPARADRSRLTGLPPAYVAVMEFDPLRDEGIAYADALTAAGVPTELRLFRGTFHGAAMVEHAGVVREMTAEAVGVLRRALRR